MAVQQLQIQKPTEHQHLGPRLFVALVALIAVFFDAALGISSQLSDTYFLGMVAGIAFGVVVALIAFGLSFVLGVAQCGARALGGGTD